MPKYPMSEAGERMADFSIVTMCRVAIIFFELGVVKNLMQKFQ